MKQLVTANYLQSQSEFSTPVSFIRLTATELTALVAAAGVGMGQLYYDTTDSIFKLGVDQITLATVAVNVGAASFTTLAASGAVSGAGFTAFMATPPALGTTTPAAVKGTTITATGLMYPQQAASAPSYVKGALYFDTTLNKLYVGGATAWEAVTSV